MSRQRIGHGIWTEGRKDRVEGRHVSLLCMWYIFPDAVLIRTPRCSPRCSPRCVKHMVNSVLVVSRLLMLSSPLTASACACRIKWRAVRQPENVATLFFILMRSERYIQECYKYSQHGSEYANRSATACSDGYIVVPFVRSSLVVLCRQTCPSADWSLFCKACTTDTRTARTCIDTCQNSTQLSSDSNASRDKCARISCYRPASWPS